VAGASLGHIAPRPRNVPLGSERGCLMPTLAHAIERYLRDAITRPLAQTDHAPAPDTVASFAS
jgi:hypothetical protein